jgi:hypothetical protein
MAFPRRFLARAFFFVADLRVKKTANDRAERESSCKQKAKSHHCNGA